jgi:hypothetical protein
MIASLLRAGQPDVLAQRIQDRGAGIEFQQMIPSVDMQGDRDRRKIRIWLQRRRRTRLRVRPVLGGHDGQRPNGGAGLKHRAAGDARSELV